MLSASAFSEDCFLEFIEKMGPPASESELWDDLDVHDFDVPPLSAKEILAPLRLKRFPSDGFRNFTRMLSFAVGYYANQDQVEAPRAYYVSSLYLYCFSGQTADRDISLASLAVAVLCKIAMKNGGDVPAVTASFLQWLSNREIGDLPAGDYPATAYALGLSILFQTDANIHRSKADSSFRRELRLNGINDISTWAGTSIELSAQIFLTLWRQSMPSLELPLFVAEVVDPEDKL
jgi:hypothetical protein